MQRYSLNEGFRPFENLKSLIKRSSIAKPAEQVRAVRLRGNDDTRKDNRSQVSDQELFMDAVADVDPICRNNIIEKTGTISVVTQGDRECEDNVVLQLDELVRHGKGFAVVNTPEYVEGTGYNVNPEIIRRLRRGDFSIQAHIDLHGFSASAAKEALDEFLKESLMTGKRAVLIIHGRGLCSPRGPVLKAKVAEWLSTGYWRKRVLAYSSARLCDGGAGATYVLLSEQPLSRRWRKRK